MKQLRLLRDDQMASLWATFEQEGPLESALISLTERDQAFLGFVFEAIRIMSIPEHAVTPYETLVAETKRRFLASVVVNLAD